MYLRIPFFRARIVSTGVAIIRRSAPLIILRETRQEVINTLKQFDDLALLLTYSVTVQAEGIMFHIKELAEKGNLKAKETYDKLYPSYLEHLRESISGPEAEN